MSVLKQGLVAALLFTDVIRDESEGTVVVLRIGNAKIVFCIAFSYVI